VIETKHSDFTIESDLCSVGSTIDTIKKKA